MIDKVAQAISQVEFRMPGAGGLRGTLIIAPGQAKIIAEVAVNAIESLPGREKLIFALRKYQQEYIRSQTFTGPSAFEVLTRLVRKGIDAERRGDGTTDDGTNTPLSPETNLRTSMTDPTENTDREIWREREGDVYADSIHVTKQGGIGINCGGHVIVLPIREWFAAAQARSGLMPIYSATEDQGEDVLGYRPPDGE